MDIPLILAILALIAVIIALSRLYTQSEARTREAYAEMLRVSKEYSDQALKTAADTARLQPKYADKMLDSLARGIHDVTTGTAAAMQSIYGPVQQAERETTSEHDDLPTPWYAEEGALDNTDPTDGLLHADPSEYQGGVGGMDGALMLDDEPFGIPGLKVGA